nr:response regulator transcription factor [Oricola nitratireducens]
MPLIDNDLLSRRELEVVRRLAGGMSNKLIARELEISEATVKVHLKSILKKLGVTNRTQAAIWALNKGVTALPQVVRFQ